MAPERLNRNIEYLHTLSKARKPLRTAIINKAPKDLIICICDCAHNFLNGNIPFTEKEIKHLSKYKDIVRYLDQNRKKHIKEKRQVIIQNGGFLPLLLTPILSIVGSLLADAIRK